MIGDVAAALIIAATIWGLLLLAPALDAALRHGP